ncbi:MAG: hypothetical protein WC518_02900 [Patescibacteria group bacterium]
MEGLKKIVNLIKKTGDKAIILDQNGDPAYVLMTIFDYERLILGKSEVVGLTEDELLDKINREIALWKDSQETNNNHLPIEEQDFSEKLRDYYDLGVVINDQNFSLADVYDRMSELQSLNKKQEEDHYYFEPVE